MKKTVKKLSLSRETLHRLADPNLYGVVGGDFTQTCQTWCFTCHPDGCSTLQSGPLACPNTN